MSAPLSCLLSLPRALGAGTYTTAPGYAQTVRAERSRPDPEHPSDFSFRDDFTKIVGTHAFKMGYELLYFTANYFQLGSAQRNLPVRQYDRRRSSRTASRFRTPATPSPHSNSDAVRQANFTSYTNHLAAAGQHR